MKKLQIKKDKLFHQFEESLKSFSSLSKNNKIIVSVSGGVDSIVLLTLLVEVNDFQLIVAHINHNLRDDSESDEKFVKDLSKKLDLPFYCKSLKPDNRDKKYSIEEWARLERYAFLEEIFDKEKGDWIMTAHHANDQSETILMNLSRKSGIAGLRGIARQRNKILRPMIDISKKEIRDFSNRIELSFKEDMSNLNKTIPRNFLRHEILKPWENRFPEVIASILKSANYFNEWSDGLDNLISRFIIPSLKINNNMIEIPIDFLNTLPQIVRTRLIRLLSLSHDDQWSKHSVNMLKQFLNKGSIGDFYVLENGWRLLYDRNLIKIQKNKNTVNNIPVKLKIDTPIIYNHHKYELNLANQSTKDIKTSNYEIVDWEKLIDRKLEIRCWKEGDVFQPLGMKGHQKISDFLINEKVDCLEKENQSVLTADGEIIWVCGKRLSNTVKITRATNKVAVLSMGIVQ